MTDFLQLNNNITHAETRNESTNQEVIRCYYCFGYILSQCLNYYKSLDHSDLTSKTLVNEEVRKQIDIKSPTTIYVKELKRQERYLLILITSLKIRVRT